MSNSTRKSVVPGHIYGSQRTTPSTRCDGGGDIGGGASAGTDNHDNNIENNQPSAASIRLKRGPREIADFRSKVHIPNTISAEHGDGPHDTPHHNNNVGSFPAGLETHTHKTRRRLCGARWRVGMSVPLMGES